MYLFRFLRQKYLSETNVSEEVDLNQFWPSKAAIHRDVFILKTATLVNCRLAVSLRV